MGGFDTTLRFDNDRDVDVEMTAVSISGAWFINDRWTALAGVGLILDGTLQPDDGSVHDVEPGGAATVGMGYSALSGEGGVPSVDLSMNLSSSWTQTVAAGTDSRTSYFAADARLGVRAGWSIGGNFYPYLAARVFGGPVHWELDGEEVVGSDIHHYQIALGAAAQTGPVGIFAEWSGLGERAFSAGLSTAW